MTPDLGAFWAVLTPPSQRILSVTEKQLGNGAVQRGSCRTPSPSEKWKAGTVQGTKFSSIYYQIWHGGTHL